MKRYTIVEQFTNDHFIRIDTYYFGIHWISEVIEDRIHGGLELFGSYEQAQERVKELEGGKKSIKRKLKLLQR